MIIDDIAKSSDWYFDENTNEWVNMTEYFSKVRNKTRTKSIRYIIVPCSICGAPFLQKKGNEKKYNRAYCSDSCRKKAINIHYAGKNHMSYLSGKFKDQRGYIHIKSDNHHRADAHGYVYEHIIIAENKYGREILKNEDVHHIDEDRSNNDPDNLEVLSRKEHTCRHKRFRYEISNDYLKHAVLVEGKRFTDIAGEFGCSAGLISLKCKKIGIKSSYGNYK